MLLLLTIKLIVSVIILESVFKEFTIFTVKLAPITIALYCSRFILFSELFNIIRFSFSNTLNNAVPGIFVTGTGYVKLACVRT